MSCERMSIIDIYRLCVELLLLSRCCLVDVFPTSRFIHIRFTGVCSLSSVNSGK
jgi:hypothetical protein